MAQHGVPEAAAKPLVFKCSETRVPPVMRRVLLQKGWREWNQDTDDDTTWSLHWKSGRFKLSDWDNCLPHQRLNHCPKSSGITKKDNLHRNIKRLAGSFGKIFDFVPTTFVLPNEYLAFAKAFADGQDREEEQFWICKPSDSSRGRGIFIISHISQLVYDQQYVVQEYLTRPLLIGGFKFDLRLYVLVKSFHPLRCFCFHEGLVRFATEKYSRDQGSLHNLYAHLTNTSINKHSPSFSSIKDTVGAGSKWPVSKLREYMQNNGIDDRGIWGRINNIIVLTVLALWPKIPAQTSGFELLGFDIMIDEELNPWLIEVNSSPALATESPLDCDIKEALIRDTIDILDMKPPAPAPPENPSRTSRANAASASPLTTPDSEHASPAAAAAAATAAGLPPAAAVAAAVNVAQAMPTRMGGRVGSSGGSGSQRLVVKRPPSVSSASSSLVSTASTLPATRAGGGAGGGAKSALPLSARPAFGGGGGGKGQERERQPVLGSSAGSQGGIAGIASRRIRAGVRGTGEAGAVAEREMKKLKVRRDGTIVDASGCDVTKDVLSARGGGGKPPVIPNRIRGFLGGKSGGGLAEKKVSVLAKTLDSLRPSGEEAGPRLDESGATAQVAGVDEDPEAHEGEGEGQSEGEEEGEETGDECVGTERDDAMEAAGRERVSGEQGESVQKVEQDSSVPAREGGGGGGGGSSAQRSGAKVPPAPSAATQATPASVRAGGSSGAALRPVCGGAGKGSGAGEPVGLGVDWDNRGPGFGEKSGKGCNGFRLVFPFDDTSCREAALAARKGSGQGNADIKPLIDLIKISDAEYRKHSSAARKKLNESQSAVLCPASACTDRSARAGDGTSSDKQPGQQGSRQDAEPWWMSPAPNRPGGFQPLHSDVPLDNNAPSRRPQPTVRGRRAMGVSSTSSMSPQQRLALIKLSLINP